MAADNLPPDDAMLAAAAKVDVIDLAGSIIAAPRRAIVSTGGQLALALAVERFWNICTEAELLVNQLEKTMPWDRGTDGQPDAEHCEFVALQAAHIRTLMNALRGTEENGNGSDHPGRS